MKKYKGLIILGVIIVALATVAIVFSEDEDKYMREVSIDKVLKMKDDDKSFILYIKQTDCEHCKAFNPKFMSALKESNLEAYVLNLTNLSTEDNEKYEDNFEISGTPTVLFFNEGEESLIKIEGEKSKDKIISVFKSAGFLK